MTEPELLAIGLAVALTPPTSVFASTGEVILRLATTERIYFVCL